MLTLSALVVVLLVVGLLTGWISQTQFAVAESYRDRLVARFPVLAKLQRSSARRPPPHRWLPRSTPTRPSTANSVSLHLAARRLTAFFVNEIDKCQRRGLYPGRAARIQAPDF